jgi:uncharacterized protein YndB with AHSA1/START domain
MSKPVLVFEVEIAAPPEKIWEAITDPDFTRRYFYGTAVRSDFRRGAPIVWENPDGTPAIDGWVLECDAPRRLVTTAVFRFDDEAARERPSRVTWEITPRGDRCRLTVTHDDFDGETATYRIGKGGWQPVVDGLAGLFA